jgi:hypothetical protein
LEKIPIGPAQNTQPRAATFAPVSGLRLPPVLNLSGALPIRGSERNRVPPPPALRSPPRISAVADRRPSLPPAGGASREMDGGAGAGRRSVPSSSGFRRRVPPAENGHGHDAPPPSRRSSASLSRGHSTYVIRAPALLIVRCCSALVMRRPCSVPSASLVRCLWFKTKRALPAVTTWSWSSSRLVCLSSVCSQDLP